MTTPLKDLSDFSTRYNLARQRYSRRNQLIEHCAELYEMRRDRTSGWLDSTMTSWRDEVAYEYHEASAKPHNVIDTMTAVLSGHPPQYHCVIPGDTYSSAPSRAEMFLTGVWRVNSRRQTKDLASNYVFKTIRDGGAAARVYWMPNPPPLQPIMAPMPDNPDGPPAVVQSHLPDTFPICIEIVNLKQIYTSGAAAFGRPYSELFYVQNRSVGSVLDEWGEQIDVARLTRGLIPEDYHLKFYDYVEWWGRDNNGVVWFAIIYNNMFIKEPEQTNYPDIPFVLSTFKNGNDDNPTYERLPFVYPLIQAIEKLEYVRSRSYRLIDLFANMNPFHAGEDPISGLDNSKFKVVEVGPNEKIEWPRWPGQPPDVYQEQRQIEDEITEGSFSPAMFGQVSSRVSGYALSQIVGTDTLRSDTPRANLELAFSRVADLIFGLLRAYSPFIFQAVVGDVRSRRLATMLAGFETVSITTETFIKPKQTNDEVRLAVVGSQLASLPRPPVSMRYILEHYFGINQPETEMAQLLDEEAMRDPIVRMTAMLQVLQESGNPAAAIVQGQLEQAVQATMTQQGQQQQGPPAIPGVGMGMPQGVGGNAPQMSPIGNPVEEVGMTPEVATYGGPRGEF